MKKKFRRRSIRLPEYDYSEAGAYFITICSFNKELIFGSVVDGKMILSEIGNIVAKYLEEIPNHFENVFIDEYVVMPNHIHFIISIVGVQNFEPLQNKYQKIIPKSIGSIVRAFKASVTLRCRRNRFPNFKWQRNYFEHIIRNEEDLFRIREYIQNNPLQWGLDEENPTIDKKNPSKSV
jgi:REP element-mobilizing transposase RayT